VFSTAKLALAKIHKMPIIVSGHIRLTIFVFVFILLGICFWGEVVERLSWGDKGVGQIRDKYHLISTVKRQAAEQRHGVKM